MENQTQAPAQFQAEIASNIVELVNREFLNPESGLKSSDDLREKHGFDSLELVELVMTVEKNFIVSIPDDVAETFKTIDDIAVHLANRK